MKLTIDPVTTPAQIDAVAALARTIWFEHYPGIISWAQVHYMLQRDYSRAVVSAELARGVRWDLAAAGASPLGFAAYRVDGDAVMIDKLYVLAASRGRGTARRLVARVEAFARETGCAHLRLTVNKRNLSSIRAYLRLGFAFEASVTKPIGYGFLMDDYAMKRELADDRAQ